MMPDIYLYIPCPVSREPLSVHPHNLLRRFEEMERNHANVIGDQRVMKDRFQTCHGVSPVQADWRFRWMLGFPRLCEPLWTLWKEFCSCSQLGCSAK